MRPVHRNPANPSPSMSSQSAATSMDEAEAIVLGPVTALVQLNPEDARHLTAHAARRGLTLGQLLYETALAHLRPN